MGNFVDYVVCGTTLGYDKPSTIVDLKTKKILRN
jgi:tRNA A37 threonylcarbamoyladenosine synthetase subunit TsaC/SUA5/YrdC